MSNRNKKWLYLAILSLVWGSSYILIKKTLIGLTPLQLGSLRIIFTTIILLFIGFSSLKKIPKNKWKWIFLTGYIGSFFPSFLFAFAQTEIDSGVAAILNSLTPLATLLIGLGFFKFIIDSKQIVGVIIGLIGSFLLIYEGSTINPDQNLLLVAFIIAASICYATSVNILKAHLQEVPAISIALGNFLCILPPALIILFSSGFLNINFVESPDVQKSLFYILILAIFGSAFAKVLFNRFIQIASPVFASSVTYTLPIVAIMWGYLDGESINNRQFLATAIILVGVYLANRKTTTT
ncbi:MAG: DMT family transporter [Flavobacteriales bacterium]|jgi:drug/metabolite transporter (DMT)-like permease|tara:strand:+ start:1966 stop:2850 length:885 start_codon:yes stop_codon:yes gene_type:complete